MKDRFLTATQVRTLRVLLLICVMSIYLAPVVFADSVDTFTLLTESYADAMLHAADSAELESKLSVLLEEADSYRELNPGPEADYLYARILAGYATSQSVLRMPALIRDVRDEMETALKADPYLLDGTVQAYLGYLYLVAPGWPLSIGNSRKGKALLDGAMEVGAEKLGVNYFYAYTHAEDKDWPAMQAQLQQAKSLTNSESPTPMLQALLLREIDAALNNVARRLE